MKIKNYSRILLSTVVVGAFMTGAAISAERVLKVTNWAEYIGEETIANFEKETGIKVIYDTYDSAESIDAKLLAVLHNVKLIKRWNRFGQISIFSWDICFIVRDYMYICCMLLYWIPKINAKIVFYF